MQTHTCTRTHARKRKHARTHTHKHARTHTRTYTCMHNVKGVYSSCFIFVITWNLYALSVIKVYIFIMLYLLIALIHHRFLDRIYYVGFGVQQVIVRRLRDMIVHFVIKSTKIGTLVV